MAEQVSFDQLEVGATWHGPGRTLTEADLSYACMSSGDWHPIHADAEFVKETPLKARIFHGTYGIHIAIGMASHFPELGGDVIAALGLSQWRYLKPLFVGDTVHVEVTIASKRETSDPKRGIIERQIRLVRHGGEVVQEGNVQTMIKRRGGGE